MLYFDLFFLVIIKSIRIKRFLILFIAYDISALISCWNKSLRIYLSWIISYRMIYYYFSTRHWSLSYILWNICLRIFRILSCKRIFSIRIHLYFNIAFVVYFLFEIWIYPFSRTLLTLLILLLRRTINRNNFLVIFICISIFLFFELIK